VDGVAGIPSTSRIVVMKEAKGVPPFVWPQNKREQKRAKTDGDLEIDVFFALFP